MAFLKLTMATTLSLQLLAYLTRHPGKYVTISKIADALGLPTTNHLTKVATTLSALGYIDTRKGQRGGLQLRVEPAELKIGNLIWALEEPSEASLCLRPDVCRGACQCPSAGLLKQARDATIDALNAQTLAALQTEPALIQIIIP